MRAGPEPRETKMFRSNWIDSRRVISRRGALRSARWAESLQR